MTTFDNDYWWSESHNRVTYAASLERGERLGGFLCRRTGSTQKAESKYALILFHYYSMQWLIFWTKVTKFTGLVNRPASKEYVAPAFAWPWRVHSPTGDVQQSEAPTKARIAGRMEIPKFWDFIGINRKFCVSIEGNLQIWDLHRRKLAKLGFIEESDHYEIHREFYNSSYKLRPPTKLEYFPGSLPRRGGGGHGSLSLLVVSPACRKRRSRAAYVSILTTPWFNRTTR